MLKVVEGLVKVLKWIGAASLACMMFVTCIDVIMRALGSPLLGAVEIVGFLATLTIAASLPHTHVMRGHAGVDMLVRRLPKRVRGGVDFVTGVLSLGLFIIIAWQMFRYAGSLKQAGEVSLTLGFPTYILVACAGGAFAVLCLAALVDIVVSWRKAAGK